ALMMEDPDVPLGVFTHWIYCDLPGTLRELPEDVEKIDRPRLGGVQGVGRDTVTRNLQDLAVVERQLWRALDRPPFSYFEATPRLRLGCRTQRQQREIGNRDRRPRGSRGWSG